MKQKLCLWGCYCLKRIQPKCNVYRKSILEVRDILTGYAALILRKRTHIIVHYQYFNSTLSVLGTRSCFLRTFFSLCSNFSRAVCGVDASRIREIPAYRPHTAGVRPAIWENTGRGKVGEDVSRLRKAQRVLCFSPPSLTLPSRPIPVCPAYTSVKRPKSGTIAKGKRLHSGRKAYTAGYRWATVRHWVGYGNTLVRQLLDCASAVSRSLVEGLSKASRTGVEARSKDCRTSLEQQSNTRRRNIEKSCVCTHAKAPARYGLGLALGLVVLMSVVMGKPGFAQESFFVSGKVISVTSGVAIEGATVTNKRTRIHAVTDRFGEYRVPARPDDILVYSFVGYVTTEKEINGREQIIVELDATENTLEEVEINAGYYVTSDKFRTGNIARITAKDIEKQQVSNPLLALQGRMPGVVIQQQNGVPGTAVKIQIRGQNSLRLEGNSPLYIIDGVPVSSEPIHQGLSGLLTIQGMDPLNAVNLQNIASIEVLKDADATSIYGSRGANGVVLITTQSGTVGRPKLDLALSGGWSNVPKVDMLNTAQYLEMRREAYANDGREPTIAAAPDLLLWDQERYTDWQDVLLGNTAHRYDAQLALSGGHAGTSYRISGGWREESMVFPGDMGHSLVSIGINLSQQALNDRINLTIAANFGSSRNRTSPNNFVSDAIRLPPNAPQLYGENGQLNWECGSWTNPLAALERRNQFSTENINFNTTLAYKALPGLSFKINLGFSNLDTDLDQKNPISAGNPERIGATGDALQGYDRQRNWLVEPQAIYHLAVGKMEVDALAGGTYQHTGTSIYQIATYGYINDALLGNRLASSGSFVLRDDVTQYRYAAAFARLAFNWHQKYLLNITGRRDGSSRFGPEKRFGSFGALGVAWIISNEPFMAKSKHLSFMKFRGSYGTTGNDRIGDYGYLDTYSIGNFRGQISLSPTQLVNPDFAWEINRKLDVELETRWFDDRLAVSANWFRNVSSNQLVGYTLPAITGFPTVQANLPAVVENMGWEFMARIAGKPKDKVTWQTSVNLSIPRNKLLSFPGIESSSYFNTYIVGRSLSANRLYQLEGLDGNGLYKIRDVNEDGRFDVNDRHVIKEVGQKYYGGIHQLLGYGPFSMQLMVEVVMQQGRGGEMALSGSYPGARVNQPVYVLKRWKQPGDIASIQRYTSLTSQSTNFNNTRNSDFNIVNASYARIRTVSLAYRLGGESFSNRNLPSCEVFINVQNLFTLTKYKGWDPSMPGSTYLPSLRTFGAGIRIGL